MPVIPLCPDLTRFVFVIRAEAKTHNSLSFLLPGRRRRRLRVSDFPQDMVSLIRHLPAVKPLQVSPLLVVTLHTEADGAESVEETDSGSIHGEVESEVEGLGETAGHPVEAEAHAENGKVESGVVVVDVGDTGHGDEGEVVQEPADDGVDAGVVNVVNVVLAELVVAALPADGVPCDDQSEQSERGGAAPVHERVAEEEVLDNVVVPTTHAETDVQERPLPWSRGQIILLIWVRDKGIVGSHHGNVEVDEVAPEGRLV